MQAPQPKPSLAAPILFALAALMLLIASFSASMYTTDGGSIGLLRGEICYDGRCRTITLLDGALDGIELLQLIAFLFTLVSAVLAAVCALLTLKPGRRFLALATLCTATIALLFELVLYGKFFHHIATGYAFYLFVLGSFAAIAAAIATMARPKALHVPSAHQPFAPQPHAYAPPGPPCAGCHQPLAWVPQYQRWFCPRCNRYA